MAESAGPGTNAKFFWRPPELSVSLTRPLWATVGSTVGTRRRGGERDEWGKKGFRLLLARGGTNSGISGNAALGEARASSPVSRNPQASAGAEATSAVGVRGRRAGEGGPRGGGRDGPSDRVPGAPGQRPNPCGSAVGAVESRELGSRWGRSQACARHRFEGPVRGRVSTCARFPRAGRPGQALRSGARRGHGSGDSQRSTSQGRWRVFASTASGGRERGASSRQPQSPAASAA